MVQRLLEADRVEELDFGRGDDDYKRLWVSMRRQRIGVILADPMHPTGLVALARHVVSGLRRSLGHG
jgi:CelD/BcsL family acetyltransferase involved in cellulose biosynthesis